MKVAVIGGGINGVMSAWALARRGHSVDLFEARELMSATSSRSTKLLHGGLRYLEQAHVGLVRSSLQERMWWITQAPHLAKPIQIVLPVYRFSKRSRWKIRAGLSLYGWLAGKQRLGPSRWHDRQEVFRLCPGLNRDDLMGAFTFYDGQMQDRELGLWAAHQAEHDGVMLHANSLVQTITQDGGVRLSLGEAKFDRVVNVAGPWAKQLLNQSGISSRFDLDLVRGSHIVLNQASSHNYMLEVPGEDRVCFVLDYQGKTLVGTTEVRQTIVEPVVCSGAEREYLLRTFLRYFKTAVNENSIESTFAGVRPLLRSHKDPTRASREYAIERRQKLVNVFGGKWTTARLLGEEVADRVEADQSS